jgi:diguanylate cyclase (GGDEF)-like protein
MERHDDNVDDVGILTECDAGEKALFLNLLTIRELKQDQVLFKEGDWERTLYIVREGIVGSYHILPDGAQRDTARYSRGNFFGETALFEDATRSTSCHAITDCTLYSFEAEDFYRFVNDRPLTGVKICKAMTRYVTTGLFEADNFLTTMVIWGEKARKRAITDELTGLHNQRYFSESLGIQLSKHKTTKSRFCLLMIDLDNIHIMNEFFGFGIVDEFLKKVGKLCSVVFKGNAIVSRLGGDEFSVLLPDTTIEKAFPIARIFKEKLPEQVPEQTDKESNLAQFTVSIGIAEFPTHGITADVLKNAADEALRIAKKQGKNKILSAVLI